MIVVSFVCLQRCSRVCDSTVRQTVLLPVVSNAGPLQCAAAHEGHKVQKQVNIMGWQGCGNEHMLACQGAGSRHCDGILAMTVGASLFCPKGTGLSVQPLACDICHTQHVVTSIKSCQSSPLTDPT